MMFGYVLIFRVCSLVQGAGCHELPAIELLPGTSIIGCMMASQIEGAKWIDAHPNFWVSRATCQPMNRSARA